MQIRELRMSKKMLVAALAATMTIVTAVQAPAETVKKKKPVKAEEQSEESANKEVMDELMLGVATGILGQAMKKGKMPKGGKEIVKHGLKAVKDAKKKDGGKDSGKKKDPLKALFGADEEE
jgi:hypothetical protein